jgi:hypothetical protein
MPAVTRFSRRTFVLASMSLWAVTVVPSAARAESHRSASGRHRPAARHRRLPGELGGHRSHCRNWGPSTAPPAPVAVAATFDPATAERVGARPRRDSSGRAQLSLQGFYE